MFCASIVGSWIDRAPSRLPPLLISILSNHGAIVAAYICWLIWLIMAGTETDNTPHAQNPFSSSAKGFQFGLILVLDAIQHLSATGNKLSLERDWVPALVEPAGTSDAAYSLTQVNAVMGRIDLICKLVAPSLLPLIISKSGRTSWILLLVGATVREINPG
jgi:iron-regulated transporter 1